MRHTPPEFSSGPTLNHNTPKPLISHPPARPSSELPSEGRDRADDPLDVAVTMQRPALDPARALQVLGPRPNMRGAADSTSEVQVEDILLEVYAEAPPPPSRRSGGPPSSAGAAQQPPAHLSIGKAIAAAVPMAPAESAALDALLRASDPAFLPFAGNEPPRSARPQPTPAFTHPHAAYAAYGHAGADAEPPSVARVAFASADPPIASHGAATPPPPSHPSATSAPARRGRGRALGVVVLIAVGLGAVAGVAVGVRRGTIAELRERAKKTLLAVGGPPGRAAAASTAPPVIASPPPPSLASGPAASGPAASAAMVGSPASPDSGSPAPTSSAPSSAASASVGSPASSAPGPAASASVGSPASSAPRSTASLASPSSASSASVSPSALVDAPPAQAIPPDSTLVTFPESAQGHRVFVDGRAIAVTLAPMPLPCGRHTIRIGSSGKPRVTDLACGQPVTLR